MANIVRSFMAERIFRKKSEENGCSDIEVSSASLVDMEGSPADPRTEVAEKLTDLISRGRVL